MKIWCFGDSWTWGSELWDYNIDTVEKAIMKYGTDYTVACQKNHEYVMSNNWSSVLTQIGNYEVSNFAVPGSSNRQILEILYYRLQSDEKPDIIIIGWSTQYRWTDRKELHTHEPRPVDKFSPVVRDYNDLFFEDNFYNEVCTAQWIVKDIPILNINAFYKNQTNNLFDERVKFADKTMLEIATDNKIKDISKDDWHFIASNKKNLESYNLKSSGHPNEIGHKLIAKYIHEQIINI